MDIDQGAVPHDLAFGRVDEAHAAHVGGQLEDLVEGPLRRFDRGPAVFFVPEVQNPEIIGRRRRELGVFQVDAPHPIAVLFQPSHQVTPDESARAADQGFFHASFILSIVNFPQGPPPAKPNL